MLDGDSGCDTSDRAMVFDWVEHDAAGADFGTLADADIAKDLGTGADQHTLEAGETRRVDIQPIAFGDDHIEIAFPDGTWRARGHCTQIQATLRAGHRALALPMRAIWARH